MSKKMGEAIGVTENSGYLEIHQIQDENQQRRFEALNQNN